MRDINFGAIIRVCNVLVVFSIAGYIRLVCALFDVVYTDTHVIF